MFLEIAERAKGIPINTDYEDYVLRKFIDVFETIILQNNGLDENDRERNPSFHYRGIKELYKYLRGEPRILLNYRPTIEMVR